MEVLQVDMHVSN